MHIGLLGHPNTFSPKKEVACNFKMYIDAPKYVIADKGEYLRAYNKDKKLKRITTCFHGGGFAPQYKSFVARALHCTAAIEKGKKIIAEAKAQRAADRKQGKAKDKDQSKDDTDDESSSANNRAIKVEKPAVKNDESPTKKYKVGHVIDFAGRKKEVIDLTDHEVIEKALL